MNELRPVRQEHGQLSEQILHGTEEDKQITVTLGWRSEQRAREYYADPRLKERAGRARIAESTGVTFFRA